MSRLNDRVERKTNPQLVALIEDLRRVSRENQAPIWRDIAVRLSSSSKKRPVVNLSRIDRVANKDEIVLIPGKVLGSGTLTKPVTIVAFNLSQGAMQKITSSGCKVMSIRELMTALPRGSGVRIME